jgi:hypothetical protein
MLLTVLSPEPRDLLFEMQVSSAATCRRLPLKVMQHNGQEEQTSVTARE